MLGLSILSCGMVENTFFFSFSSGSSSIESPYNDMHDDDSDENLDEDQEELLAFF